MKLVFGAKIYVSIALIVAAVFSPLALSFVPIILLVWYLYEWRWPVSAIVDLLNQYFVFFALAALYSSFIYPLLAPLVSLPVLWLIINGLEKSAPKINYRRTGRQRSLTRLPVNLLSIALAVLVLGWALSNPALVLAAAIVIIGFIVLGILIFKKFPARPIEEEPVQQRILAGKEEQVQVKVNIRSRFGGLLFVSADQDWIKVKTRVLWLKGSSSILRLSITPGLSGPSTVKLKGYAIDRWGLSQNAFDMEPVKLHVIPRARYAAWLAQRYMAGSKPGTLPMLADMSTIKALQGLRQGIEYYGNRLYQPGDVMKNIDWKHTSKYHEVVVKEFTEFQGQPAILLVNLVAGDAEEADKQACNIIVTALTLARENIPAALAVYNHEKVVLTTAALSSLKLVLAALQITKEMIILANPVKFLNPPDILKLRSNTRRLSLADDPPARALAELLRLEYMSLSKSAKLNPCTRALSEVTNRVNRQSNVVVLSRRNHDAEAIEFNSYLLSQKGISVINIDKTPTFKIVSGPAPANNTYGARKPEALNEMENNLSIAGSPMTDRLVNFHMDVWNTRRSEFDILTSEIRGELAEAYADMLLANNIVWLTKELGRNSQDLIDSYNKLRNKVAERLQRIRPAVRSAFK